MPSRLLLIPLDDVVAFPGMSLTLTVDALRVWAETHIEEVLAAQKR